MSRETKKSRRYVLQAAACACCLAAARPVFAASGVDADDHVGLPTILELGVAPMTRIAQSVWVAQLTPEVWLYTVTHPVGGYVYPANGLIVTTADGGVLIDTGWTPEHAVTLTQWAAQERNVKIDLAVATHFHDDRTGGVDALRDLGVRCVAHPLTTRLAREHGYRIPDPLPGFDREAYRLNNHCELYYGGGGHTRDNIVVWLPDARLLYGGCFLKSATAADLGYLGDAVVADWAASLAKVQARYPAPDIIVPGHGALKGDSIGRTRALLTF